MLLSFFWRAARYRPRLVINLIQDATATYGVCNAREKSLKVVTLVYHPVSAGASVFKFLEFGDSTNGKRYSD
jgi:hypothetical protein